MDTTIPIPSTDLQVQGSLVSDSPKATLVEEVHNQSGDSTDSLKENQPENNRSSRSLLNDSALSKSSSQQPLIAPLDNSLTGGQPQEQLQAQLQPPLATKTTQPTTCNDSAFHHSSDDDDDESFADCPTFNSPAVNKLLLLGRTSNEARQSLGLDALTNNMGKFTFDSSICANSTVDIVATGGAVANELQQVVDGSGLASPLAVPDVIPEEGIEVPAELPRDDVEGDQRVESPLPPPPPVEEVVQVQQPPVVPVPPPQQLPAEEDIVNMTCDDVEMMSVVMENPPPDAYDYASVPLPEEAEEAFPDPPPPQSNEIEMDVDLNQSSEQQRHTIPEPPAETPLNTTAPIEGDLVKDTSRHNLSQELLSQSGEQPMHNTSRSRSMEANPQTQDEAGELPQDFKMPTMLRRSLNAQPQSVVSNPFDGAAPGTSDHKQEVFFSSKDFDFLQSKETANSLSSAIKDSVLLRFDPLINQPVVVESRAPQTATGSAAAGIPSSRDVAGANGPSLSQQNHNHPVEGYGSILEEDPQPGEEDDLGNEQEDSLLQVFGVVRSQQAAPQRTSAGRTSDGGSGQVGRNDCPISKLVDVTMSLVDVNNDSNLSVSAISGGGGGAGVGVGGGDKESSVLNGVGGGVGINNISNNSTNLSNINLEDLEYSKLRMSVDGGQHHNQGNESKIRNERYDDMDRKLKEMEEKEEVLLKRLTEKEKQIAKMGHIVEEYERSIAGVMKERAVTKEEYERRCAELETERNANYQHLSSLETTFSDLHVKYERSKQQMEALKRSEEILLADKKQSQEQAAAQEQRYLKLKVHAMNQMEMANVRLRDESSQANQEISRLRALLKKEEITRCSLQEQLNQKTREIEELMKIWDELKSDP